MMVIYDPSGLPPYNRPWTRAYFDGCFGDRQDSPSKATWVVPGTWPDWVVGFWHSTDDVSGVVTTERADG